MRKDSRLRRRRPFRVPRARFLIACEGTVTEPHYFSEMRRLQRSPIELEIIEGGTPKTIVERAVERKKEAEWRAQRQRDDNLLFDEIWCVFDVDTHPFLPEAKQQARDNGISVAISNPCFELWILLHFQEQHAHIERGAVQRLCREHLPDYKKRPPCDRLAPRCAEAMHRAAELDQWHGTRGTTGENPSTGVYRLVDRIQHSVADSV
jgi:hypothetical protein